MIRTPSVISDEAQVTEIIRLMSEEIDTCSLCAQGWQPNHFRCYYRSGMINRNADCGSNSRRYSPSEQQFVGHPHCSCDACF